MILVGYNQNGFGQSTRSSFGISVGSTNFWMQNILNQSELSEPDRFKLKEVLKKKHHRNELSL